MKMRMENGSTAYWLPELKKDVVIKRGQEIDEDGKVGTLLKKYYAEDCILEGETKSLIELVGASKDAIANIENLQSTDSEIDKAVNKTQTVLPKNLITNGKKIVDCSSLTGWTYSSGDEGKVTIDSEANPFGGSSFVFTPTVLGESISAKKVVNIDFATIDYIDIPVYYDDYSSFERMDVKFFNGTNLYSNYLTTVNMKYKAVTYGTDVWHLLRFRIDDLVKLGTIERTDLITNVTIDFFCDSGFLNTMKIGDIRGGKFSRPAITFSFDDANETDSTVAYQILKDNGFSGTSFIISSIIGNKTDNDFPKLDLVQMQEMYNNGWTFGIHGHVWSNWLDVSLTEAEASIKNCRDWLYANNFTTALQYCAYPENKYNQDIKSILLKYGVDYCRTTNQFIQHSPIEDFQTIKCFAMKKTFQENKDLIDDWFDGGGCLNLYAHELYNNQDNKITEDVFRETIEYIKANYSEYVTTIPQWCKDYETGTTI